MSVLVNLVDAEATQTLGARLTDLLPVGSFVALYGDLGMGKTTLTQGYLRAMGHSGLVKSPTYTLVESYDTPRGLVHHFDLYRLGDPEELEFMGIRDYFDGCARVLIEWPARGDGVLPSPDIELRLTLDGRGRVAELVGNSERGKTWLEAWSGL